MRLLCAQTQSPSLLSFTIFFLYFFPAIAANECKPATWKNDNPPRAKASPTVTFKDSISVANIGKAIKVGEINCRYWGSTYDDVNCCTCAKLAKKYGIKVKQFLQLNPELDQYCGNIEQYTNYCVRGFVEPLRATNGLCGPPNNNATCKGTPRQCCNAETWTCGNTKEDCAPGTCYEGQCAGDRVWSTDGTCGYKHGNRMCAGKWGDCCNMNGTCGTGPDFCSIGVCHMGNCTRKIKPPGKPWWLTGNTTDGTCGGVNNYTCSVIYGNCCNKDGLCGSETSDCEEGCQPEYGTCISTSTSTSSATTSETAEHTSSSFQKLELRP